MGRRISSGDLRGAFALQHAEGRVRLLKIRLQEADTPSKKKVVQHELNNALATLRAVRESQRKD